MESAVSVCFPFLVHHHVVLTNYYFLCCVKNLQKKRVHRKRDRKDQPSFTEKAPLLEEYNSSYESRVCVCVFPFLMLSPLQDNCVTLCLSLFFSQLPSNGGMLFTERHSRPAVNIHNYNKRRLFMIRCSPPHY